MTSKKTGLRPQHVIGVLLVVAVVAWYGYAQGGWFAGTTKQPIRGVPVMRGPLRISIVERGSLKAADSVSIKSEIEGQATILYLHPEGRIVEEGTLVVELDASSLIDERVAQLIKVRNADAAYVKSSQNLKIQESENTSAIARAEQDLLFAEEDIGKYEKGDRVLAEEAAKEAITLADEQYKRAAEKLTWSQQLAAKGFLTQTELEADELALTSAKIKLDQAQREQRILLDYTIPRERAELKAAFEEAQRELERVRLQAEARLVDFEADEETNKAKLDLEREALAKLERQIDQAKIHAPRRGMVVYSQGGDGGGGMRRFGNSEPIAEGTTVRERQEIITIPSTGGMIAQASLHESVLKQVHSGQTVMVKVDALGAGKTFRGEVDFVAPLPDQQSWFANPDVRLYRTDVTVFDATPDMRPGMSCSIEVLVEDIAETLYVPVQAVFRHAGNNICFLDDGGVVRPVTVEIGLFNSMWVQILSGLTEGQTVLMSAPPDFQLEADRVEGEEPRGEMEPQEPRPTPDDGLMPTLSADGERERPSGMDGADAAGWRERFENMSEEEKKAAMERFQKGGGGEGRRGRRGEGGGPGGGGGDEARGAESPDKRGSGG
jgi:HlyD family secretion protein